MCVKMTISHKPVNLIVFQLHNYILNRLGIISKKKRKQNVKLKFQSEFFRSITLIKMLMAMVSQQMRMRQPHPHLHQQLNLDKAK